MSDINTTAPTPTDRVGEDVGRLERVRHLKRGFEYEVLGEAEAQVAEGDYSVWPNGADPYSEAAALPARLVRDGSAITVYRCAKTGKLWARFTDEFRDGRFETIASAPAPSDPAGAGGDLGELERLSKAATPGFWRTASFVYPDEDGGEQEQIEGIQVHNSDGAGSIIQCLERDAAYIIALVNAHRSGQLVASTPGQKGAGEEKTGASFGPGSCPSGPTASRSSGFAAAIPSRDALRNLCWSEMPKYGLMSFEQLSEAVSEVMLADRYYKKAILHTEIFIGHEVMTINFNSLNRIVTAFVQAALALGTEAGTAEPFGLGSKDDGPADLSATPEATPHQSPSPTTETNPPMSLEEARAVLDAVGARTNPQTHASLLRGHAIAMPAGPERDALTSKSARIEAALRTLHAAGEVRHG